MIVNEKVELPIKVIADMVKRKYPVSAGNCDKISEYVKELNDNKGQVKDVANLIYSPTGAFQYVVTIGGHTVYMDKDIVYDYSADQYVTGVRGRLPVQYIKIPGTEWYFSDNGKAQLPSSDKVKLLKDILDDMDLDKLAKFGYNIWLLSFK